MRLLFCIKALNNPGGGAERVMVDVVNGLLARGHEISVLTFERPGGQSFYKLDPRVERLDLGLGSTTGRATATSTLARIRVLRDTVRRYAPDVAVGFMHSMFVPLGAALLGTGTAVIGSEHIVPDHYRSRPIEGLLLRIVGTSLLRRLTCVSEQVRAQYPPALRRKMIAIPNPTTRPAILAKAALRVDGTGQILTVGRLVAQKDHDTLIRAFASIAGQFPQWSLRIVGDGELAAQLTALAEQLGLLGRIEFAGSTPDISAEYARAQIFVNSSLYESFGLATAEALAHGLPAIGFADCAGTNILIRPGENGILVEPAGDRVGPLATALEALLSDQDLRVRLGENARTSRPFDIDVVLDAWEALLRETTPLARQPVHGSGTRGVRV